LSRKTGLKCTSALDLIIAGWECQGFSAAGSGDGLEDHRSGLFMDMVRVLTWAQALHPSLGYVIENTPAQYDKRDQVWEDFVLVQHYLGQPLLLDAVHCGSYAHRLQNLWTKLAPLSLLELTLMHTQRDPT
jgi:C-5 cytosine-specific DNA methylase